MDLYTYLKAIKLGRSGSLFEDLVAIKSKVAVLIGTDTEPYQYRISPSLGAYKTERDEIVGVSVGFNQLVDTTDTSVTVPSGHKYIARINGTWSVGTSNGTALTVDGSNNDMVIDLTAMLGSTIADYIVTQGNTNGVAFFRKYFGADYYPYDSGSIRSVEGLVSHDMVGFNLLDEDLFLEATGWTKSGDYYTGNMSALEAKYGMSSEGIWQNNSNYTGQICVSYTGKMVGGSAGRAVIVYEDGTYTNVGAFPSTEAKVTTVSTAGKTVKKICFNYGSSGVVSIKDFCVNLSWDGSRDGEYEPYEKHSYPLDSDLTLRGIPKLDASNNLYYDGDVYEPNGTVNRRYEIVTLDGTEQWSYNATAGNRLNVTHTVADALNFASNTDAQVRVSCDKLVPVSSIKGTSSATALDYQIALISDKRLYVSLPTSVAPDVAGAKAWFSAHPTTVVYELATPTTDTAQPFAKNQKVSPSGTEEYVASGFNVWDEEWEVGALSTVDGTPQVSTVTIRSKNFTPCVSGASYYVKCANYTDRYALAVYWYDADKAFVSREYVCAMVTTAPANAKYFKIVTNSSGTVYGTTYNHDICINLSDTSRNGQYVPHGSVVPVGHNTEYYG